MQFVSPTTGLVPAQCFKCGGELVSDPAPTDQSAPQMEVSSSGTMRAISAEASRVHIIPQTEASSSAEPQSSAKTFAPAGQPQKPQPAPKPKKTASINR